MILYTPAKINLGLNVTERRSDGFHNLETVFFPLDWKDILEVTPSREKDITLDSYGINVDVEFEKHLCVKAYRLLQKDFDLPGVQVYLHKNLPLGAGLGGGSSNAAGMLKALNELFHLNLSQFELVRYASHLGSDCALFMYDGPTRGEGRGELLTPFDSPELKRLHLQNYQLLLIKPPFGVSTAEAYAGLTPHPSQFKPWDALNTPVASWRQQLTNDFEPSVFIKCPEIGQVKKDMYEMGAEYACMSGSGSTVYGIFPPGWKWSGQRTYPATYLVKQLPL
jgi:4-diphosphocytidyl-2-C-methyl-D-erythritol kinase